MKNLLLFITFFVTFFICNSFAQEEIDIVDPYQMKVSRSKEADTFYFTQNAPSAIKAKQKLDTLRSYDVFLEERPTPFGTAYMCNGIEVTKKKYLEYKQFWNASGACQPCLLYTYNDKNNLKYVAFQYEDCLCGSYKEYYADGTIKTEGQFKQNTTGNWLNMKGRDLCNVRDGKWIYYLENGVEERTETYLDGKLKESSGPVLNSGTSTKNKLQPEGEESEVQKGLFRRIKDKNNTSGN